MEEGAPVETKLDRQCQVLLRDFGYRVEGSLIIQNAIRGVMGERIFRRCRSLYDAVEQLVPVIHSDEFSERYRNLGEKE